MPVFPRWFPGGNHLGTTGGHLGTTWEPPGDHLGITWEPPGDHLGIPFGQGTLLANGFLMVLELSPTRVYLPVVSPGWIRLGITWQLPGNHLGSTWGPTGNHLGTTFDQSTLLANGFLMVLERFCPPPRVQLPMVAPGWIRLGTAWQLPGNYLGTAYGPPGNRLGTTLPRSRAPVFFGCLAFGTHTPKMKVK